MAPAFLSKARESWKRGEKTCSRAQHWIYTEVKKCYGGEWGEHTVNVLFLP